MKSLIPTQAARLIEFIRSRPQGATYGELEWAGIGGTCPWRRLSESGHRHLKPGEKLERVKGSDGLVRFVVKQ